LGFIFFFFVRRWKRICFTPFQPPTVGIHHISYIVCVYTCIHTHTEREKERRRAKLLLHSCVTFSSLLFIHLLPHTTPLENCFEKRKEKKKRERESEV
jgi:hypothetical protein